MAKETYVYDNRAFTGKIFQKAECIDFFFFGLGCGILTFELFFGGWITRQIEVSKSLANILKNVSALGYSIYTVTVL